MNLVCTARPHGVFRNGFDLVTAEGDVLAMFVGSVWSERGTVSADGASYPFVRRSSALTLLHGDVEVATARRRSWFTSSWDVGYDGRAGVLVRRGFWTPGYALEDGAGTALGRVSQEGVIGRSMRVDLPAALSLPARTFLAAVVLTLANRARASSG